MYDNFYIYTSITIDRVFLLLKAHLLGVTRGDLYSRNVASFYYCGKIYLLETTTAFTILYIYIYNNLLSMTTQKDSVGY